MNERLKLLRKTLKLSQDAFAERIGMKGSSISLLESGGRNIPNRLSNQSAVNLMLIIYG